MDAYPPEYVEHNLPLIVLSGLDTAEERNGPLPVQNVLPGRATTTISSELPPVTGERAQQLLQQFLDTDGSDAPWNGRNLDRRGNIIEFKIRAVGRVGQGDLLAQQAPWTPADGTTGIQTAPQKGRCAFAVKHNPSLFSGHRALVDTAFAHFSAFARLERFP